MSEREPAQSTEYIHPAMTYDKVKFDVLFDTERELNPRKRKMMGAWALVASEIRASRHERDNPQWVAQQAEAMDDHFEATESSHVLIVESDDGDEVKGAAEVEMEYGSSYVQAHLNNIVVASEHRGEGLGDELLAKAEAYAAENKAIYMNLIANGKLGKGQKLVEWYMNRGYELTGQTEEGIAPVMRKDLRKSANKD